MHLCVYIQEARDAVDSSIWEKASDALVSFDICIMISQHKIMIPQHKIMILQHKIMIPQHENMIPQHKIMILLLKIDDVCAGNARPNRDQLIAAEFTRA